jgi:hypothetical protein
MFFRKSHQPPDPPPPRQPLRCSFCNKSQRDVEKLIAGPGVYICCECVEICNEIVADDRLIEPAEGGRPTLVPKAEVEPEAAAPVRCALCRMLWPIEGSVSFPDRGWLCRPCLDAVRLELDTSDGALT